jgi:hypothetical protein
MIRSLCCSLCGSFGVSSGIFLTSLMLLLLTSRCYVGYAFLGVFVYWAGYYANITCGLCMSSTTHSFTYIGYQTKYRLSFYVLLYPLAAFRRPMMSISLSRHKFTPCSSACRDDVKFPDRDMGHTVCCPGDDPGLVTMILTVRLLILETTRIDALMEAQVAKSTTNSGFSLQHRQWAVLGVAVRRALVIFQVSEGCTRRTLSLTQNSQSLPRSLKPACSLSRRNVLE